jgi:hypothetical protein
VAQAMSGLGPTGLFVMWISRALRAGRARSLAAGALLGVAAALGGCSAVVDRIPTSIGGLPEGVPPRPTTPQEYPAVHDMPPARAQRTLNEAERDQLRDDLAETRERAARAGGTAEETTASVATTGEVDAAKAKSASKSAPKGASKSASKSAPKSAAKSATEAATAPAAGSERSP